MSASASESADGFPARYLVDGGCLTYSLTVAAPRNGNYLLTVAGAVRGARSVSVSLDGWPAQALPMTGSSTTSPLVARSFPVRLYPRSNTIRFFDDTAYAPTWTGSRSARSGESAEVSRR